jgi:hypothetical protein
LLPYFRDYALAARNKIEGAPPVTLAGFLAYSLAIASRQ